MKNTNTLCGVFLNVNVLLSPLLLPVNFNKAEKIIDVLRN